MFRAFLLHSRWSHVSRAVNIARMLKLTSLFRHTRRARNNQIERMRENNFDGVVICEYKQHSIADPDQAD